MKRTNYLSQAFHPIQITVSIWLTCLLLPLAGGLAEAQQKNIEERYLEYFKLPRETLFLHTNKTTYLTNEDIWFKAYAYDRKNGLSSKSTTNIYFGLYDEKGTQLSKKLYLSRSGAAAGNFALDSTVPSGEYFLKVSTNWMKNFYEDDGYIQKIQIINPKSRKDTSLDINTKEYDFQFLPEGGHALVGVKSSIGIKAIDDQGKGIVATGVLVNSRGEETARFKTNALGIGKFTFIPEKDEKYTAKVTLDNGKEFEQGFSDFQNIGVAMTVNNLIKDRAIITLSLNNESFDILSDQNFKLLLHKDGYVKSIPVIFDGLVKQIVIARKDLYSGMNTVTLFNEKEQPILERIFFNASGAIKNFNLFLSKIQSDGDSISFKLRTKVDTDGEILNTSISVLPGETKSYDPDHSIVSALHLKPYVQGTVENPQYYFKNFNRRKQSELDALLVTQGWSRYSWDRIFNLPPKPSFDFENGVSINGFVNRNLSDISQLFLYRTNLNKSAFINIDAEGKFNISGFYPTIEEEIRFSYMDKKGKMKRPSMSLSYVNFMGTDNVNTNNYKSFQSYYKDKNQISDQFIIDDSYEQLDEIQLKTDYKEKLRRETRDPILVNGKVTRIEEEQVDKYPFVTDFIQDNGFDVMVMPVNSPDGAYRMGDVVIRSRGRGAIATTSTVNQNNPRIPSPSNTEAVSNTTQGSTASDYMVSPTVFLDGMILNDFNMLLNMGMELVERIVIDKTGIGLGLSGGFGGAIKIYSRRDVFIRKKKDINTTVYTNTPTYGFEPIKEFYTPKYASYQMQSFKDYGIIHWLPNLNVQNSISSEFKIVDTKSEEVNFYIEGISSDGSVFSQLIKVDNSPKK